MNADTINWIITIACGGAGLALFAVVLWRERKTALNAALRLPGRALAGAVSLVGGTLLAFVYAVEVLIGLAFLALLIKGAYLFIMFSISL